MHVLFSVNNYPPSMGGVQIHVARLAESLVKLGHNATVITSSGEPGEYVENGVRIVRIPGHFNIGGVISFPRIGTARWLRRYVREHHVDVISTHTRFFPMSIITVRAMAGGGVPIVHTEHGSDFVAGLPLPLMAASRLVDLTLGRRVLRKATVVLAVSEASADFVTRLSAVDARVFHNAIDTAPWLAARGPASEQGDRLTFLGRLVPGKGWETFIEVVAALRQRRHPGLTAAIIGEGIDHGRVQDAVRERGMGSCVAVTGRLSGDALVAAVAGSILVNPTVLSEGLQTSLIESLASGGRVATYPVPGAELLRSMGGPVEICSERTAAAMTAAVERLLDQPREPLAEEAVLEWDWTRRAREYVDILEETLARSR